MDTWKLILCDINVEYKISPKKWESTLILFEIPNSARNLAGDESYWLKTMDTVNSPNTEKEH